MQYMEDDHETTGVSRPSVFDRKTIRNELRGYWQEDEAFFEKHFPVKSHIRTIATNIKAKLYSNRSRWSGIPKTPESAALLHTPLTNLLNSVLSHVKPKSYDRRNAPRMFIKTYDRRVIPEPKSPTWPAILLAGADRSFVHTYTPYPRADYRLGISPLEVRLESEDLSLAKELLATNMQRLFNHQPNRRYAFGLIITQNTLSCHLFDHSGVVSSLPLNYHHHPAQLCALIAGLTSSEGADLGLDTSIFVDDVGGGYIRVRKSKHSASPYVVEKTIFHAPRLVGRGTTCFLTHREDKPDEQYVIKDAWIAAESLEGRDSEASLLLHAQREGVVKGVAQIYHSEDIRVKGPSGRLQLDSILNNRRIFTSNLSPSTRQRVHTRIVLSTYGKSLERFSNRKELLLAYYDAVRAHRNLHDIAGILHRDIKPGNILIKSNGVEGDRGVLIDLDHAIRTDNVSPYSSKRKIGTYLFMSRNALEGKTPHGYLDDLESFYYVLVYILTTYAGPDTLANSPPPIWKHSWAGISAAKAKTGHFVSLFNLSVGAWFGTSLRKLVGCLHSGFRDRLLNATRAELAGKPIPPPDSVKVFEDFTSYIRQAIVELDIEEVHLSKENLPARVLITREDPEENEF